MVLALAACGGGGGEGSGLGGGGGPADPGAPAEARLSITAATGAAFVDATITVTDSTGVVVGSSGPVGADGVVAITLAPGAQAPLVITATRSEASGETTTLVSVVKGLSDEGSTTVNVTPVTTLVAALLSRSGDPAALAPDDLSADRIDQKVAAVQEMLQPLLEAAGVADADPLSTPFETDGTGYDRVLDSLVVQIIPTSDSASNITVAVKDDASKVMQFTSDAPPQGETVAAVLAPEDVMPRVNAFLQRLQSCYALPVAQRLRDGIVINPNGLAVGATAGDVAAPECKAVFWQQDPTQYLQNGQRAGSRRDIDLYNGLFSELGTGVTYSQGTYEYAIPNTAEPGAPDDIVVSFKARTVSGNESFHTEVLRPDGSGALRLRGNQYQYPGAVLPAQIWREFINAPQYNYLATGYRVAVRNWLDAGGNPIFDRVEVTTPRGRVWPVLQPQAGQSFLTMNGLTASIRLNYAFEDPDAPRGIAILPELEQRQIFATGTGKYDDSDILKERITGKFTFRYFLAGNDTDNADAVQYYRLRTRPLTLAEMRARSWPQLSPALVAAYQASGDAINGVVSAPTNGPVDLGPAAWSVAEGALPVSSVTLWGRLNGGMGMIFSDSVGVRSTERTATIGCVPLGVGDDHCAASPTGAYADGYGFDVLELHGLDQSGGDFGKLYAFRKLID